VAPLPRDMLLRVLRAEGVLARRYFYPGVQRLAPYHDPTRVPPLSLPNTERAAQEVLSLPTGETVSESMIDTICGLIELAVSNAGHLSRHPLASGSSVSTRRR
jgi:dTDP-4-amino-4,6-dideoxygalactose transaminase